MWKKEVIYTIARVYYVHTDHLAALHNSWWSQPPSGIHLHVSHLANAAIFSMTRRDPSAANSAWHISGTLYYWSTLMPHSDATLSLTADGMQSQFPTLPHCSVRLSRVSITVSTQRGRATTNNDTLTVRMEWNGSVETQPFSYNPKKGVEEVDDRKFHFWPLYWSSIVLKCKLKDTRDYNTDKYW